MRDSATEETWPATELAQWIVDRLETERERLTEDFNSDPTRRIRCCVLDDLLPEELFRRASQSPVDLHQMLRLCSLKERKYVTAAIDDLAVVLQQIIQALNQISVVNIVTTIMGADSLKPDDDLYNGGLTLMAPGDFMCPHTDNSHDHDRVRRRDAVLLCYLSPIWQRDFGGHLELWDGGPRGAPRTIEYVPNRLVLLEVTAGAWHSVSKIIGPIVRRNVTCYYYAPPGTRDTLRLTRFRGRPGQPCRDVLLAVDYALRSVVNRLGGGRIHKARHINPARQ
jgi:hypothetical protein